VKCIVHLYILKKNAVASSYDEKTKQNPAKSKPAKQNHIEL